MLCQARTFIQCVKHTLLGFRNTLSLSVYGILLAVEAGCPKLKSLYVIIFREVSDFHQHSGHNFSSISFCFRKLAFWLENLSSYVFFCQNVSSIICQNQILLFFPVFLRCYPLAHLANYHLPLLNDARQLWLDVGPHSNQKCHHWTSPCVFRDLYAMLCYATLR